MGGHPRRGPGRAAPVEADAADARRATRARPRHAGAHLLQGRIGQPGGVAQAEHRRAAGLLQQGGGHQAPHHRDRRGAVGHGAGVRLLAVRPRVQGVHGAHVVRVEALPPRDHGDLGSGVRAVSGRRPVVARFARPRHLRRGARRGHPRRLPLLARLGAQPRAAAPDGHRAGGQGAARPRRRAAPRRRDRTVRWRLEPRWPRPAVRGGRERAAGGGRAVVVPDAHRGHGSSTTSATPRG